ncbi:FMN-binding protein [Candidatus Izemoplasma sp. B36]|uniref:FMN-binding protein n=1 Tax=Candidatus Izemoplasma sp. B36 TaxID=3242468 RepID=UPI0035568176
MSKTKKIGLIIFIIIVILTALGVYFYIQINDGLENLENIVIEDIDLSTVEDGTYTGEYTQTPLSVIVQVEVFDHEIVNILILKHDNGQGNPAEVIINSVIASQSIDVDSIAGATYSSIVILLAIQDALS